MTTFRTLLATAIVAGMFATIATAGIVGTKHDFAGTGWAQGETCLPCHTPHGGSDLTTKGPLWNHEVGTDPQYTFKVYDATGVGVEEGTKLDPNTMLCMSCHDGRIALDSFGGVSGNVYIGSNSARIGNGAGDLTGNHPVGSAGAYPTADGYTSTAGHMIAPYIFMGQKLDTTTGTYVSDSTKTVNLGKLKQLDGKYVVGCTTCHEPHNRRNQAAFLWVKNSGAATLNDGRAVNGSALCLACHKK